MTGALENSDTFRDDGYIDRKAIAPSAYFKLSDDLELNLGGDVPLRQTLDRLRHSRAGRSPG